MHKLIFTMLLLCCAISGFSQVDQEEPIDLTDTTVDNDKIFELVEVEAQFPGGEPAWAKFLQNNLVYPKKAKLKKIQGTVLLQFIVDKGGSVDDIEVLQGPKELRESAINVLKKMPTWKPAYQNGHPVTSYKKQPVVFRIK